MSAAKAVRIFGPGFAIGVGAVLSADALGLMGDITRWLPFLVGILLVAFGTAELGANVADARAREAGDEHRADHAR